ncbi:MAG TPA: hypothetical protein ENK16_01595, partial [Chromatiales bacterium]|nr:hypothetical protein [Chromatiales bacterium]
MGARNTGDLGQSLHITLCGCRLLPAAPAHAARVSLRGQALLTARRPLEKNTMKYRLISLFVCLCALVPAALAGTTNITLKTVDGVSIRASLSIPETTGEKHPAVILIHQGGSNRHEWDSFVPMLLKQGDIVLAYDVRGHGDSDKVSSIYRLFNDPEQAPKDLQAAIDFLKDNQHV